MSYSINFMISGDYLRVHLSGTHPIEKFSEISSKIDEVILANSIIKILVNLREFSGRFGVFDGIKHIEKFKDEAKFLRFALLDEIENKHNNDFFENASYNRGYSMMFFYNEPDALKWLQVEGYSEPEKLMVMES